MAGELPAISAVQGDCQWHLKKKKTVEIFTDHVSPQSIATEAIPTYIKTSQWQKDNARQLKAMSHTPPTVLQPPGLDCVTVYNLTAVDSCHLKIVAALRCLTQGKIEPHDTKASDQCNVLIY